MARLIVKLVDKKDNNREYYLDWSTIVDAPVTYGLSRKEFDAYYRDEYGRMGMPEYETRMARVDAKGTSSALHASAQEVIHSWAHGFKFKTLEALEEAVIEEFCRNRPGKKKLVR